MPWVFLLRGRIHAGPSSVFVRLLLRRSGLGKRIVSGDRWEEHLSYEEKRLQPSFARIGTQF